MEHTRTRHTRLKKHYFGGSILKFGRGVAFCFELFPLSTVQQKPWNCRAKTFLRVSIRARIRICRPGNPGKPQKLQPQTNATKQSHNPCRHPSTCPLCLRASSAALHYITACSSQQARSNKNDCLPFLLTARTLPQRCVCGLGPEPNARTRSPEPRPKISEGPSLCDLLTTLAS